MAAPQLTKVRRPGGPLRLLPLVSILAWIGLALTMVSACEADAIWGPSCEWVGIAVQCPSARTLWLSLAVIWTISAILMAVLMALEVRRTHAGRSLDSALLFAYVTSSLLLFGVAFLEYEPRRELRRGWATVLAVVNGAFGLVIGYLVADAILHPPMFA